ncbi:hypothetical protein [Nonomuraea sp. SYSU D8015]|uniref:hypothetical protein n=1 Tax=Nonomuraea sp. SYSU D8015 TaxID=2593644 RepID=UPI001660D298|nr:hypothetical protein [Nonomuraea sp. SYSU D8015]
MYRAGLILAGLAGGMVAFGGSALAVSPSVTAAPVQAGILQAPSDDDGRVLHFGEWNNFGEDNDVVDLDLLNELLSSVLSG